MPRLVDREVKVSRDRLIGELVPPPLFAEASFDSYYPDPAHPTQAAAREALQVFANRPVNRRIKPAGESGWRRRRRPERPGPPEERPGVYLDGGFGVGKTHLLAALWHAAPGPKAFGTFVELTNLAGALGFQATVEALSGHGLVCIDEFELDDPGDTVLVSSLLGQLVDRGVRLGATSNTLPDRLGEGRFAAEDFLREIQGLSAHFDVYRIDGPDYRHRGLPEAPTPLTDEEVLAAAGPHGWIDQFPDLVRCLGSLHPSRYGALLDGVPRLHLSGVRTLTDQADALRLVVLADRLYDRGVPLLTSGVALDRVFDEDMLRGGYRKKYFRAVSRLVALGRIGQGLGT